MNHKLTEAEQLITKAQQLIKDGKEQDAMEILSQASSIAHQINDDKIDDLCKKLEIISTISIKLIKIEKNKKIPYHNWHLG